MSVKRIDLSYITVKDLNKARKLYVDTLGFIVNDDQPEIGWLELRCRENGMMLGIAQAGGICTQEAAGTNAIPTLKVDSIESTKKELLAKGMCFFGHVIEVPGHVKLLTFADDDGNKFQLVEEWINNK